MTSFICMMGEDQVILATDTLATTPDGTPSFFTSKATHVPHLKSLIMGTGVGGFANRWASHVAASMVLSGINNLDYHTPSALRGLWEEYRKEHDVPADITTTVYHFGLSEEDAKMCGFAYRSTDNFLSEPLNYGWRFKPECSVPDSDDMAIIIETMMREQRQIQETRPLNERVFIGGDAILHHLVPQSYAAYNLFKFEDYGEMMRAIFSNYQTEA
ncbi:MULTISPECIES: hypothetical protein [Alphaproteobacteria]|uniref:hypothetical protein n=1 Tax=Alphaproteobacteria TaxID=28211 RepID=UPI0032636614